MKNYSRTSLQVMNGSTMNDFDDLHIIKKYQVFSNGCKKKYYYEKIREIWTIDNSEIVFDTNPGVTDRMEIESKTKKELNYLIKYLNLNIQKFQDKYLELFGIVLPKSVDLTFQNCKKTLLKYVKKNKSDFIKLVESQIIKYNKLKK